MTTDFQPSRPLGQIIGHVPLFKGLSANQLSSVLSICSSRPLEPGERTDLNGDAAGEMLILMSGELAVLNSEGVHVANVSAGMAAGDVGLLTGRTSSSTFEAVKASTVLTIRKRNFDEILAADLDMTITVQRNMIELLASRLVQENVRLRDHVAEKSRYEGRIEDTKQRLDVTMDILADKGTSREEAQADVEDRLSKKPARILIVDDEAHIRSALKRGLAAFDVLEAANGREALDIIEAERQLDLVITDIKMPDMDGFTFLTHARAHVGDLRVIAMSAYVDAGVIDNYPFDGFIQKPARLANIRKLVNEHLSKS